MRQPMISRSARGTRSSVTASVPAPTGGWNTRDPEARMKTSFALWMENWWPGTAEAEVRKGCEAFAKVSGKVLTLMPYSSPTSQKLFAATATDIYDISGGGEVITSDKTITDGKFCYTLYSALGGTFLQAVNGLDKLQMYDGTSWKSIDDTSTPAITGVATENLTNICLHKRRLWYVEKASMSAWYLPVNQIAGALVEFPLGQLFRRGGHLLAITSWTIDGGDGVDDNIVFITSEGEIAVYQGTDPSDSANFSLVGVYYIGEPIGRNCFIRYGGDVLLLTQIGLFPLSKALMSASIDHNMAVSDNIAPTFTQSAIAYGKNYGWGGCVYPSENALIVNVPTADGYSSNQLAMNTITNAWTLFTGWNAFCFGQWQESLYYGGDGVVAKAFSGRSDFGANIIARVKTAFNFFKSAGSKHFKLIRPIIRASGTVSIDVGMDADFKDKDTSGAVSLPLNSQYLWGTAQWDTALWGAEYETQSEWRTVFAEEGFCAALRLRVAVKDVRVGWSSTDFLYQQGGSL